MIQAEYGMSHGVWLLPLRLEAVFGNHRNGQALRRHFTLIGSLTVCLLALPITAKADVPARYRVCASVSWKKPSRDVQGRHLARNARWSKGDRNSPVFQLDFPFHVRVRSGSISYDQTELSGMWTLTRNAWKTINRCPFIGGPGRNFGITLRAWTAERSVLTSSGDLIVYAHPQASHLEELLFPGYGNRSGFSGRDVTLVRTDAPGCAISSITSDESSYRYGDVLGIGLDCDATRALVGQVDVADDFDTTVGGFSCASGLQGYSGIQETCVGGAGQALRMGYYDTSSDQ